MIEGGIRHQCWWRCSHKPGQSVGGDALQSLARMDLQQQQHTLSSIRTLFLTQLWMNPNWKYPIGFISHKIQNRLPMDGEGDEPQPKKNCQFLLVYLEDCFRATFGARAFHFSQLFRVPSIIWKVLLFYFYLYSSFFHIWRGSDLRNIWRFFMQTQGLSFNPSAIFHTLHSSLLVSDKRLKSRKGLLKIDLSFVLNCHPDLPW